MCEVFATLRADKADWWLSLTRSWHCGSNRALEMLRQWVAHNRPQSPEVQMHTTQQIMDICGSLLSSESPLYAGRESGRSICEVNMCLEKRIQNEAKQPHDTGVLSQSVSLLFRLWRRQAWCHSCPPFFCRVSTIRMWCSFRHVPRVPHGSKNKQGRQNDFGPMMSEGRVPLP
ncbi:hypothetical protein K437DRAFT_102175 [Tilletiaria anomala UBC 951]|uniref:Uncharacterized protein n=1 Tax=Tilletiaria anomala (strain ATCC 24038 / CBS 436.72 / UBC 951) TaxID=1037660 RepID=A0A066W7A9_TILAU|nr:uncharacterized protein K437DRAFT_102175 [Tilletiaria anomala UBC 951]KDN46964.1 hypothetical protein K437DRAFT_102175 [Tilletiaria anomala UBC 951]